MYIEYILKIHKNFLLLQHCDESVKRLAVNCLVYDYNKLFQLHKIPHFLLHDTQGPITPSTMPHAGDVIGVARGA
jgi:hypothetical protein